MNKAAFLNIVRQVAPIQDQEVDDLERLVVSFPYCQTAHVLLAKAAHDRGSMLSTQKLRRAAAHVSNRQLLKQLVYAYPALEEAPVLPQEQIMEQEPAPPPVSEPFTENQPLNAPEETEEELLLTSTEALEPTAPALSLAEPEVEEQPLVAEEIDEPAVAQEFEEAPVQEPMELLPVLEETEEEETTEDLTALEEQDLMLPAPAEEEILVEELPLEEPLAEEAEASYSDLTSFPENNSETAVEETFVEEEDIELPEDISLSEEEDNLDELLELIQINSLSTFNLPYPSVDLSHEEIISELTSGINNREQETEEEIILPINTDSNLPAQVKALVAPEEDPGLSAYLQIAELDSLYDTSGYEFPTLKLPEVPSPASDADNAQDPYLSIFTQNNLAYWMGSSRLGESIQLKDDLTSATPFYFQPELILEHVKGKAEPAPAPDVAPMAKLDQQLDIINQFLKTTPKRKTLANAQLTLEPQEDLSAKSSKIKKTLVSENLALIFIKQGKGKKAVKIYEQLIVKFPEKKSYFAEQIEKLRNE
ncbi:hypothetical protein GCM10011405_16560 [Rufibacter glacialis]|nr:hypothetical protein FOE74_09310 [Rufibacter glacialis]GGK69114.1 hypothetical protein GCM10011405_16560 [Rufibacter glacialis]